MTLAGDWAVKPQHKIFNSASLCIKNKLKERYEQFWERRKKSDEKNGKIKNMQVD